MRIPRLADAPVDFSSWREVPFDRKAVWEWMLYHPVELLQLDPFHARVEVPPLPLRVGTRFVIHHELPLGYRQRRVARVNSARPWSLGMSELSDDDGIDWFPHSIHFRLEEPRTGRCLVGLRVRGRFLMPGARYWWMPWFRVVAPYRMDNGLGNLARSLTADLEKADSRTA